MSLWLTHYTTDPAQHILLDLSVDPTKQSCVTIPGKHRDGIDGGYVDSSMFTSCGNRKETG